MEKNNFKCSKITNAGSRGRIYICQFLFIQVESNNYIKWRKWVSKTRKNHSNFFTFTGVVKEKNCFCQITPIVENWTAWSWNQHCLNCQDERQFDRGLFVRRLLIGRPFIRRQLGKRFRRAHRWTRHVLLMI